MFNILVNWNPTKLLTVAQIMFDLGSLWFHLVAYYVERTRKTKCTPGSLSFLPLQPKVG